MVTKSENILINSCVDILSQTCGGSSEAIIVWLSEKLWDAGEASEILAFREELHNEKQLQNNKELNAAVKGYEMAIEEVYKAYPADIFPNTTQAERDEVIKNHRGFIDRTSAKMGRHIAKVIKERAEFFANEILEE